MIKKFLILFCLTVLLFSCGKKGNPVYKENNQDSKKISAQFSTIS